jgi:Na+/melibiose symporter-like transporter
VFQFLQTVGILVGVIYHIMTLWSTQKTREPSLKAKEQIDARQ